MWEKVASLVAEMGGQLVQNSKVVKIETQDKKITAVVAKNQVTGEETRYEGDYFISTMPVKELIEAMNAQIPDTVREVSSGLIYRDFITVGLLLSKLKLPDITDNWIYIQEPEVKVGRLQIFNNWSPFMVKDPNTVWVGLEYFCNEKDELWELSESDMKAMAIRELSDIGIIFKEDVLDSVVIKMPKTYPAYFGTYDRFGELKSYVDQFSNLFLVGRNGMHKYNNQDHSMLTAIEAVRNIRTNVSGKENIWAINAEQEYHEEK